MRGNFIVLMLAAGLFFARGARADEVAPALEGVDLRVRADAVLRQLLGAKPEPKLRGLYAAFDPRIDDALAQVACDDDGDYVIVLSDAMLRLVSYLARIDDAEAYAAFLVRNQQPGKLLLQPPAGVFPAGVDEHADARSEAMLRFLYARELAYLRAGALVCPNPTTTRERGDAEWTAAEQKAAAATAARVYPSTRDEAAIAEVGPDIGGARALLAFFAAVARAATDGARLVPSYVTTHPRASAAIPRPRAAERLAAPNP